MNIIICIKRVPDVADVDLEIDAEGRDIRKEDLVYEVNEWDNFVIEEAVRLKEAHGGSVTALTVGDEDDEEVLRRALAMGADEAIRLAPPHGVELDAYSVAGILRKAIAARPFDLVLTGSVSSDAGSGVVGGAMAALLNVPQVALATGILIEGNTARVRHEVEGGLERIVDVELPAVVTIQTGINEPRYVSIRGIRRVGGIEIPVEEVAPEDVSTWTTVDEVFIPKVEKRAEILEGSPDEIVDALIQRLKDRVGV